VATPGAITALLLPFRATVGLATVTLLHLLAIVLVARSWGRGPSLVASLLAFLTINFFFTRPYYALAVAGTDDVVSLLVFLLVAELTARLTVRMRQGEAEARARAWEAATLYTLSRGLGEARDLAELPGLVAVRLAEVLEAARCAVFLRDRNGRLVLRAMAPGSPGGPPPADSVARPREPEDVPAPVLQAFLEGRIVEAHGRLAVPLTVDGQVAGVVEVQSRSGEAPGPATRRLLETFAGQAGGVLERLRLQREAQEAEVLRQADEAKSALLAAVSHDLRTPLASIRIAATTLLQQRAGSSADSGGQASVQDRELLEMIDAEASRLARLVNNLLDLSRLEAGVLTPVREWRDLQEVITRALDDVAPRLREHQVVVDVPADLPLLNLDFTQIEDVLVNLLDNAARHAPGGTAIAVRAWRQASEVVVQVENAGPPIPSTETDRIFEPFHRLTSDGRGLGLGLAICKRLIEAHGGRIWVERPGAPGARLAFTLPVDDGGALPPPPEVSPR
jgi:two-component system sensor histidine kinase KdpD